MNNLKNLLPAIIIAIGIAALGWFIKAGLSGYTESSRVVTVKGLSEREVKADKVIWPITFVEIGDDLSSLYSTIEAKNSVIISMLKSKGISDNEISTRIDVEDMKANAYSNNVATRYKASSVITVNTRNVDTVLGLMKEQSSLIEKGIAISLNRYENPVQFEFTGLNNIKPEMIKDATQNARKAAQQFATDSESELGKIRSATQGQFTIEDRDQNTPYIKNVRVVTTIIYSLED